MFGVDQPWAGWGKDCVTPTDYSSSSPHPSHWVTRTHVCANTHAHIGDFLRTNPSAKPSGFSKAWSQFWSIYVQCPRFTQGWLKEDLTSEHCVCCVVSLNTGTFEYKVSLIPDVLGFVWRVFLLCKQFQPLWGRGLIDFRASVFTDASPDGSSRLFWRLEHVVITWPLFKSEQ